MAKSDQRLLHIRVKYEPNRLSERCLESLYEQLSPIQSRSISSAKDTSPDRKPCDPPVKKQRGEQL